MINEDEIVDSFYPKIKALQLEVDSVDDLVLILKEKESADLLTRIGLCRRRLTYLHRMLSGKPDLLKNLVKVISGTDSFNDLQWYMADVQGE
jgi:magnesium transporter